jgi:hypothetical protein
MIERRDVAGHLADIVQWDARRLIGLVEQQIRQGGLCPLDLGGEDRLLPDVQVENVRWVGQQRREAVEPAERQVGMVTQGLELVIGVQRRIGRQPCRYERLERLWPEERSNVPPCHVSFHVALTRSL